MGRVAAGAATTAGTEVIAFAEAPIPDNDKGGTTGAADAASLADIRGDLGGEMVAIRGDFGGDVVLLRGDAGGDLAREVAKVVATGARASAGAIASTAEAST
jgi:hypothetical protein